LNTVLYDTNFVEKHFYDIHHNPWLKIYYDVKVKLPRTKQYKYDKMQFIESKKQYCTSTNWLVLIIGIYYIRVNLSKNNRINYLVRGSASAILCTKIKRTKKNVRRTVVGGRTRYHDHDHYERKRRKNRRYLYTHCFQKTQITGIRKEQIGKSLKKS
jgi:hypothetical protein